MTRFGVMKHLRVLEEANLVVTRKRGPRKAPFPEPRPDPARLRALGQQVRRALGGDAHGHQKRTRGGAACPERIRCPTSDPAHPRPERNGRDGGVSRSTSRRRRSASGRRSPTARCGSKYTFGVGTDSDWTEGSGYSSGVPGVVDISEGGERRSRSAAQARADHDRALERRGEGRGRLAGDLGDQGRSATHAS